MKELDLEQLKLLIRQEESATLDFKQEWYEFEGPGKERQIGEMVKDILALANGNVISAGNPAYLIIGVADRRSEDGTRELFDTGENTPTVASILDRVSAKSKPPLESIQIMPFTLEGNRIFVIMIPPTPHLYETTRRLDTKDCSFSEYVVFMRPGDKIKVASAEERTAILKAKQRYFSEIRNVPPMFFGIVLGAVLCGLLLASFGEKLANSKDGILAGGIVGSVMGGIMGGTLGYSYKMLKQIRADWPHKSGSERAIFLFLVCILVCFYLWLLAKLVVN